MLIWAFLTIFSYRYLELPSHPVITLILLSSHCMSPCWAASVHRPGLNSAIFSIIAEKWKKSKKKQWNWRRNRQKIHLWGHLCWNVQRDLLIDQGFLCILFYIIRQILDEQQWDQYSHFSSYTTSNVIKDDTWYLHHSRLSQKGTSIIVWRSWKESLRDKRRENREEEVEERQWGTGVAKAILK